MDFAFFNPWQQVLPTAPGHIVSFVGGRDKGTIMAAVNAFYADAGIPSVVQQAADPDPGDGCIALVDVDGRSEAALRQPTAAAELPPRTSLLILVVGADAVGGQIGNVVEGATDDGLPMAGLAAWNTLEWDQLADFLLAPGVIPGGPPVIVALSGLEDQPDSIGLFGFVGRLTADPRLPIVWFCSRRESVLEIRAACRRQQGDGTGTVR